MFFFVTFFSRECRFKVEGLPASHKMFVCILNHIDTLFIWEIVRKKCSLLGYQVSLLSPIVTCLVEMTVDCYFFLLTLLLSIKFNFDPDKEIRSVG